MTARKPHSCSWCDKEILPGEKYVTSTLKTDYIYEWRECSRRKPYVDEMFDDKIWGDYDPDYLCVQHYLLARITVTKYLMVPVTNERNHHHAHPATLSTTPHYRTNR